VGLPGLVPGAVICDFCRRPIVRCALGGWVHAHDGLHGCANCDGYARPRTLLECPECGAPSDGFYDPYCGPRCFSDVDGPYEGADA
jgi:hypothetical protein